VNVLRRQETAAALSDYSILCLPLSLADRWRAWFSGQRTLSMIFDRFHGALPGSASLTASAARKRAPPSDRRRGLVKYQGLLFPRFRRCRAAVHKLDDGSILKAPRKLASCASAIREQKTASRSTDPRRYQCKCLVAAEQPRYLNLTSFSALSRTVDAQSGTMRLQPQRPTRLRKQLRSIARRRRS
jgi:hypothetical protein